MDFPVLIVNGPNLNMLGKREPGIYGHATLADIEAACRAHAQGLGLAVEFFQSNDEGALISHIQQAVGTASGVILNAGGYSTTSVALLDALSILSQPVIEVHLTNIYRRERFRHKSYVSMIAKGVICGFGAEGYLLALTAMKGLIGPDPTLVSPAAK
jgi:3-dehydroquinate dehydratase-2